MIEYFKALSDINRLRILSILTQQEMCVCELEVILDISQSNLSKHLKVLKANEVIVSRKQSLWTLYSINELFVQENSELLDYININKFNNDILNKDILRLKLYHNKKISCQQASENKEEILKILNT